MVHHEREKTLQLFKARIDKLNSRTNQPYILTDDDGYIKGSLGAVDCTYTIRSRVRNTEYDDMYGVDIAQHIRDPMYSEYIKHHALKLSVITSNSIGDGKEIILDISVLAGGVVSDSTAFTFCQRQKIEWYYSFTLCLRRCI